MADTAAVTLVEKTVRKDPIKIKKLFGKLSKQKSRSSKVVVFQKLDRINRCIRKYSTVVYLLAVKVETKGLVRMESFLEKDVGFIF